MIDTMEKWTAPFTLIDNTHICSTINPMLIDNRHICSTIYQGISSLGDAYNYLAVNGKVVVDYDIMQILFRTIMNPSSDSNTMSEVSIRRCNVGVVPFYVICAAINDEHRTFMGGASTKIEPI